MGWIKLIPNQNSSIKTAIFFYNKGNDEHKFYIDH